MEAYKNLANVKFYGKIIYMLNFRKVYNQKIFLLLLSIIFQLNNAPCCYSFSSKDALRIPLTFSRGGDILSRAKRTLSRIPNGGLGAGEAEKHYMPRRRELLTALLFIPKAVASSGSATTALSAQNEPQIAPITSLSGQITKDGDYYLTHLNEFLIEIGFSAKGIADILNSRDFKDLLQQITRLKKSLEKEGLENTLSALRSYLDQKGFLDIRKPHPLFRRIVSGLYGDNDVLDALKSPLISKERQEKLAQQLFFGVARVQLEYILLKCLFGDNAREGFGHRYAFNLVAMENGRFLFIDFAFGMFQFNIPNYYINRNGSEYHFLIDTFRLLDATLSRLNDRYESGELRMSLDDVIHIGPNAMGNSMIKDHLNLFCPYFVMNSTPGKNFGFASAIDHSCSVIYSESRRYGEAMDYCNKSLSRYPGNSETHVALGVLHRRIGELLKARERYKIAIKINPSDVFGYRNLAEACYSLGMVMEAKTNIEKALRLRKDVKMQANLDEVSLKAAEWKNALFVLRKAVEIEPRNAIAWRDLCLVNHAMGYYEEAEKALAQYEAYHGQAQEINAGYESYLYLGWIYYAKGREEEALENWARAIRAASRDNINIDLLGYIPHDRHEDVKRKAGHIITAGQIAAITSSL